MAEVLADHWPRLQRLRHRQVPSGTIKYLSSPADVVPLIQSGKLREHVAPRHRPDRGLRVLHGRIENVEVLTIRHGWDTSQVDRVRCWVLGIVRLLLGSGDDPDLRTFVDEVTGPLLDYDRDNDGSLIRTLRAFSEADCSQKLAADRLSPGTTTRRTPTRAAAAVPAATAAFTAPTSPRTSTETWPLRRVRHPSTSTLAAFTIASAASIAPTRPLVSTIPRAPPARRASDMEPSPLERDTDATGPGPFGPSPPRRPRAPWRPPGGCRPPAAGEQAGGRGPGNGPLRFRECSTA